MSLQSLDGLQILEVDGRLVLHGQASHALHHGHAHHGDAAVRHLDVARGLVVHQRVGQRLRFWRVHGGGGVVLGGLEEKSAKNKKKKKKKK